MKAEQQQQAERLYFQTDLTKTEIAEIIGVSRRSLHYWIKDNNWDRLKTSAQHMPSLLAENCYFIMSRLQDSILSEDRRTQPITQQEVNTLHKLTVTIGKLKGGNALNEHLETMTRFMDHINLQNPAMAELLKPVVHDYLKSCAAVHTAHIMPETFSGQSHIPAKEGNATEQQLDEADLRAWSAEDAAAQKVPSAAVQAAGPVPVTGGGNGKNEAITRKATAVLRSEPGFIDPAHIPKGKANNRAARRRLTRMAA